MNDSKNSMSTMLSQFLRLQKNSLEVINSLSEVSTSKNNTVNIEILDDNGDPTIINIPSYGYLSSEIERIDNNIKSLSGIGDNVSSVRNADGTYSILYKKEILKDPKQITNINVPSTFNIKNNWFFENFLTPLLYINIDVTEKIRYDSDRILVKRLICNTVTTDQKKYFDTNIKGRNDINYNDVTNLLSSAAIGYFVDEDIVDLPLRSIKFTGNFGVLGYYDDYINTTDSFGNVIKETRRNYKLDKLTYTDNTQNILNSRTLEINDKLSTEDGTIYLITSVIKDQNSIQVKRLSGYQSIMLGADILSIYSTDFGTRYAQINIGYDERQIVFIKDIDDNFNITSSTWSNGISFWSNDLKIKNNEEIVDLKTYYLNEVADFGKIFLGSAKERKIPAIEGIKPEAPTLNESNFKVVQINKQLTDSVSISTIEEKIALKSTLKSEIKELDYSIRQGKLQINTGLGAINEGYKALMGTSQNDILTRNINPLDSSNQKNNPIGVNIDAVKANLNSLISEKNKKTELYASLVSEINTLNVDLPQLTIPPKYRVRGFWPIPRYKDSSMGKQEIIQFIVKYRYLNDGGAAMPSEQIEYIDIDGIKKNGSFSNWNEYKTDIRKKAYNPETGFYEWIIEDTLSSDVQNINQLDLPITKGEKIEIKIASVSEAGWPDNPLVSEYSDPVIISFPDNLSVSGISEALKKNIEDSAITKIKTDLDTLGLNEHINDQFIVADHIYYHNPSSLPSGFYTDNGSIINLFDKLKDLQNQITMLQSKLGEKKGVFEVYIIDRNNNKIKVSKGSIIKLNAGFYNEIYTNPTTTDAGKIVSTSYNIQLYNSQATPIELASLIPGGLELKAPSTNININGYDSNLRYGDIPISLSSYTTEDVIDNKDFRQIAPYASSNAYSQFIYTRYRNVGHNQVLYFNPNTADLNELFTSIYDPAYMYDGNLPQINFGISGTYPQNGTIFTPFDPDPDKTPSAVSDIANPSIWNGSYATGGGPEGNGLISEFCIHKDHTYLSNTSETTYANLVKPAINGKINYSPFRHTQTFWADTSLPNYWVQQAYRTPIEFNPTATEDNMYADKLGFSSDDEYLIGKYSCGAYLFLNPQSNQSLQVPGTNSLSTISLEANETNAINIPFVFQFRATDKLGYIGGWRKSGALSNITYVKKIGIDIQIRNEDMFSFDIQVTGGYKNATLVAPNFDSGIKARNF